MIFSEMEVEYFPHLDCDVFIVKLSIFNFPFSIFNSPFSSLLFCSKHSGQQFCLVLQPEALKPKGLGVSLGKLHGRKLVRIDTEIRPYQGTAFFKPVFAVAVRKSVCLYKFFRLLLQLLSIVPSCFVASKKSTAS